MHVSGKALVRWRSFRDSIKLLEADIQHANTLRWDEERHEHFSKVNIEGEEECGICMEIRSKVLLPNCNHEMCLKCYREWHSRSQSCPFCRDSLKRVNSGDLWIFLNGKDVIDMAAITSENLKRLFTYVDKLPLIVPDTLFDA